MLWTIVAHVGEPERLEYLRIWIEILIMVER